MEIFFQHNRKGPRGILCASRVFRRGGFTLVEILIVGALIALFAGFAIINIQQYFKNTLRKVTIAETHQIATASAFAYDDVGIFPKFCYLNRSLNMLYNLTGTPGVVPSDMDYIGWDISGRTSTIVSKWRGSYFAFPATRSQLSQARGGEVRVLLPQTNRVIRWPADPWGNPYVLYSLYIDEFGRYGFVRRIGQEPNFFNAVVSYGPNRLPGSNEERIEEVKYDYTWLIPRLRSQRLFTEDGAEGAVFRLLSPKELLINEEELVGAYSKKDRVAWPDDIGIIDPGSDDLFYEF